MDRRKKGRALKRFVFQLMPAGIFLFMVATGAFVSTNYLVSVIHWMNR